MGFHVHLMLTDPDSRREVNTPKEGLLRPALPKGELLAPQRTGAVIPTGACARVDRDWQKNLTGSRALPSATKGCDLPHDSRERPAPNMAHKGER